MFLVGPETYLFVIFSVFAWNFCLFSLLVHSYRNSFFFVCLVSFSSGVLFFRFLWCVVVLKHSDSFFLSFRVRRFIVFVFVFFV